MNKQSITFLASALLLFGMNCNAGVPRLLAHYESLLAQADKGGFPDPGVFFDIADAEILDATPTDIESMTPVVRKCLQSPDRTIRAEAAGLLYLITARADGAQLVEPYVDDLVKLFDDPDNGLKTMAISAIGKAYPRPSQKALAALAAHLPDERNTNEQFVQIAASLLRAFPADANMVHAVLMGLANRPDNGLHDRMIGVFGLCGVTTAEALAFIRAGFANPSTRETSIQAVGRMPKEIRETFVPELQRSLTDLDAAPSSRSAAVSVLMQKN